MNFEDALMQSVKELRSAKERGLIEEFIVIGAIALSRVATVRSTGDIDFAVRLGECTLEKLAEELQGKASIGDAEDPLLGCVNVSFGTGIDRVNIQLIQFPKGIENAAFWESEESTIKGVKVPFASWKGLLMLKLYAGSSLDMQDAQSILGRNPCSKSKFKEVQVLATRLRLSNRLARLKR